MEDERRQTRSGRDAVKELAENWRLGVFLIDNISDRREAYNVMLSMPKCVDPLIPSAFALAIGGLAWLAQSAIDRRRADL
jgi:hypothetical protein